MAKNGNFDVIVHGCNCFCTMGAGIAKGIKQNFPEAYEADLKTEKGAKSKLGTISSAEIESSNGRLVVVNAYTQYDWRGAGIKVDYGAVRSAFKEIRKRFTGLRIGYPAIGAGLAGGDWKVVSGIIEEELSEENHIFVQFDG